jgi:hypothetical protein
MEIFLKILITGTGILLLSACHSSHVKQDDKPVFSIDTAKIINPLSQNVVSISSLEDTVDLLKIFNPKKIIKSVGYFEDSGGLEGVEINTILSIPSNSSKRYLIVFITEQYSPDTVLNDCHAAAVVNSMAEADKVGGVYKIVGFSIGFDTTGQFGNPGEFSLEKFGKYNYLLHVSSISSGQGEVYGSERYVDIPKGNEVFCLDNYDNEDDKGTNTRDFKKVERVIKHIQDSNKKYEDLEVATTISRFDIKKKKIYKIISKKFYRFDEKTNKYIEFKKL